jgi:alpha-beta hydrolase superfamily lysophospholipase
MLPKTLLCVLTVLLKAVTVMHGPRYVSGFVNYLAFGSYLKRIPDPTTKSDWLTTDRERVQEFMQDPLCGFSLTLNGFKGMAELISGLYDRDKIVSIDKDFPMHFIFGEEDPVGDYGVSAYKSCRMYSDTGMKRISNRAYPGKRHELLHEDIREEVMDHVFTWLKENVL